MRSMRSTLAIAAVVAAAACSPDTVPTATTAPATPAFDRTPDGNGSEQAAANRHYFELKGSAANQAGRGGGGGGTGIFYHGGPLLQAFTNVAAVYWASSPIYSSGPSVGTTGPGSSDASNVGYFLNHLGGSSYFNINTTYTNAAGLAVVNQVNYTQFWANGTSAPTGTQVVSDAQMIAMLQSGFNSHALTYDPNTVYAIFTSGAVNLGGGFGGTNFQYCAYHTHGTVSINGVNKIVLYAAMPYNAAYPTSCSEGVAPNGDVGADAEVNTLAHEIEETTTDMLGNAWYDKRGYENADKCAWNFGTTQGTGTGRWNITVGAKHFMVQQNWVNAGTGGCLQQYP